MLCDVWPVSRVFVVCVDFVLGDYCDHVVVVCDDVCGCCVHACHGNVLVLGDCMVMCVCSLAAWDGDVDVVYCVYNVVLDVVVSHTCCCCVCGSCGDNLVSLECMVVCDYV